jgi:hypothetical protein
MVKNRQKGITKAYRNDKKDVNTLLERDVHFGPNIIFGENFSAPAGPESQVACLETELTSISQRQQQAVGTRTPARAEDQHVGIGSLRE